MLTLTDKPAAQKARSLHATLGLMDEETEIIMQLLEAMNAAIAAGDWKIDGACDPDMAMRRATAYIEQRGYAPDGITGETWVKS